jgi:chorismate dehydratase
VTEEPAVAPLVDGIDLPPWNERAAVRRFAHGSELAAAFDAGAVMVALLPAGELLARGAEVEVVPGIAVGTDGAAGHAALVHDVPLEEVRTIASAAPGHAAEPLTRLLFAEAGADVRLLPPDRLADADARLLVGGAALEASRSGVRGLLDLGSAWTALSGLPFVWFAWVARPGVVDRSAYAFLHSVRSRGRRRLAAGQLLEAASLERIAYRLGRRQLEGLREFGRAAAARGLVESTAGPRLVTLSAGSACEDAARRIRRERGPGD